MPTVGPGTAPRLWNPLDGGVPGPLSVWYDAQRPDSIEMATGVATWRDLSGNGNHLAQTDTTKQPAYGVRAINGRPLIDFDGTNDYLAMSASTLGWTGTLGTFYVVCVVDAATNERIIGMSDGSADYASDQTWAMLSCDGTNFYSYYSNTQRAHIARTLGAPVILTAERDTTDFQVYTNATTGTFDSASANAAFNGGRLSVAASYSGSTYVISGGTLNGAVGEVLGYRAAHTQAQRQTVWGYLSFRWGIPLTVGGASSPPLVFA